MITKAPTIPITQAVTEILTRGTPDKFDETVSISLNLGLDPRKPGQNIRGTIPLPFGLGKKVTMLVLTDDEALIAACLKAGVTYAGLDEYIKEIQSGSILNGLDRVITTPACMPKGTLIV